MNKSTKKLTNEYILEKCHQLEGSSNYDFSMVFYENMRTDLTIRCLLHGEFTIKPGVIIQGKGCPVCEKLLNGSSKRKLSLEQYIIVASEIHNNQYDYSLVDNISNEKISIVCEKHGIFMARKSAHIASTQQYGCPKCSRGYSKSEEFIENFLKNNNVKYVPQKTFDKFIGGSNQKLPYDFYTFDSNLLIEFDGIHHYQPVKFGKDQSIESQKKKYKQIRKNDKKKNLFIFDNDLRLLRIKYTRAKDIELILQIELLGKIIHSRDFDGPLISTYNDKYGNKIGELIDYF